jgi:hypothetical protein
VRGLGPRYSAAPRDQQLQFLQLQGLQRQPPLMQLQVQAFAFFSIFFSIAILLSASR